MHKNTKRNGKIHVRQTYNGMFIWFGGLDESPKFWSQKSPNFAHKSQILPLHLKIGQDRKKQKLCFLFAEDNYEKES